MSGCTAAAAATAEIPPRPSTFVSAPNSSRQARSSRCGRINDNRTAIRSCSTSDSVIAQPYRSETVIPTQLPVSYTHLRAHETDSYLVCRLLLEKKKKK